ncbi:Cdc6/Cdc18 family protein [Halorussus litoreus]|uniref:Cdc6/Cdc18 family protein n=1 Tax=Halorussus litoreus TaxID=1710536 RepID=UPI000E27596E|nr:AAA family ATPase [Halorussus litoreus]
MTKYDDLFDATAPDDSVFADKGALDPLADSPEVVAREAQEEQLARLLNGIQDGYLPTSVSIYGPPGTGKTLTTRRVCQEFADRTTEFGAEYVNLKECRTLFSAANEILVGLTGEQKQAYEGLDGVFSAIWDALETYPRWTVLILDEIDHIQHDSHYDPNDFFYRLLRGEGRLARGLNLSLFLVSNELLEVDLRLDSRVQSAMSGEEVFFPPYDADGLAAVVGPRLDQAFRDGALPAEVRAYGVRQAADRWGDARKTLTLFRHAGETATERGREAVTRACLDDNLSATDKAATVEKLTQLPFNHFHVLSGITGWTNRQTGAVTQPVTTAKIADFVQSEEFPEEQRLGERAIREILTDLETRGLVETWIDSRGREGRVKQVRTTFEPQWVRDAQSAFVEQFDHDGADAAE